MPDRPDKKDFFISYNKADRAWAEWIAWQLEEAAFSVVIEQWDFRPGGNFALDMHRAASQSERTIAVFSPDFLEAVYVHPEWAAAFAEDPTGQQRILVPVKVRECKPDGLLRQLIYIDLIGAKEDEAKRRLLEGVNRDRAKPNKAPAFPGASSTPTAERLIAEKPDFPGAFPPVWHIPRPQNPHFVGRDELLAEMRQTLLAGKAAALTALHGLGGVGKTQLAAEYANEHRADYKAVWWLNADTEATTSNNLAALAGALDLPEKDAREIPVIVEAVLRWLNAHTGWLLIYDNATNAAAVGSFLPQGRSGHVIVTSRDPNWRGLAQPLEVKVLDAKAGAHFLLERTGQTDAMAAHELAMELGGLPLALEQAGAYCETTGQPLEAYLRLFKQRWQELLRRGKPDNYPATVATTWEISFEATERECPAAAELLNLLAFCAPEELPLSVLRNGKRHLPKELAATVADELTFEDAIAALRRYSLLARRDDGVTLHRLVQLVARDRIPAAKQQQWATAMVNVVNNAFPNEAYDIRAWPACEKLLSHAQIAAIHSERLQVAAEATGRLFNQIGSYFSGRAQYSTALQFVERSLRLGEATFGINHPMTANRIGNLGEILRHLGRLDEARRCHERAQQIDETISGPNHPKVAAHINNLGLVLHADGKPDEALQCFERAVRIGKDTLGPNHATVVSFINNLGYALLPLGRLDEARSCFEHALQIHEITVGTNHPSVARDLNNLGGVAQTLGRLNEAHDYFERALKISETSFGPNHPDVAIRLNNLGDVLRRLHKTDEARQCHERALHIYETTFGLNHTDVAEAANNLGCVLHTIGDLKGARQNFERALGILTARLGAEHPNTVLARKNLESLG